MTTPHEAPSPLTVFFSYAHEDETLRNELEKHLRLMERQGLIAGWHDRDITAGQEWATEIDTHLDTADIILLLVSADFLASDYCMSVEMDRAMARHSSGEAIVIPIILRAVDWQSAPFGALQALPTHAKAITSWSNQDEAFADVARGIRRTVEAMKAGTGEQRIAVPRGSADTTPGGSVETTHYTGQVKLSVCRELVRDWPDLADYFDIPPHERVRFPQGREPQAIWEWLESRSRLAELAEGLIALGRRDLVQKLPHPPR